MSFLDQIATSTDADFINRVQQAAVKIAIAVAAEAPSQNAEVDTKRASFALTVLHNPQKYAHLLVYGIASQGLSLSSTDANLENTMSAIWNAYSGV
jgi:hypothetical protein